MAGTRFQAETYNADRVALHLRGLARRASDMHGAWPAVAVRAARAYKRSFDNSGPGWKPLKRSTELRRMRDGFPSGPPLIASRHYYKRATNPATLFLVDEGPDSVAIAVDDRVAEIHQEGTGRVPARPLKISFGDRMLIVKEIDRHLHDGYFGG